MSTSSWVRAALDGLGTGQGAARPAKTEAPSWIGHRYGALSRTVRRWWLPRRPRRRPPGAVAVRSGRGRLALARGAWHLGFRRLLFGLSLGRLLRPLLVEVHAPLAFVVLLELELGPERASGTAAEAGDGLGGAADPGVLARLARGAERFDQLLGHPHRQRLARLPLPDHEAAARVVPRPAGVALAVLGDLAATDRAWAELGPLDPDTLQLVELPHRLGGERGDVTHERRTGVLAVLDQAEPLLPVAGQLGRGERVAVQEPDHLDPLLGRHE